MKSARSKFLFWVLLLGLIFPVSRAGADEEAPWTDRFFREFDGIKSRITALEEQQKEVLAKENTILEKLDQLRVWVHRK